MTLSPFAVAEALVQRFDLVIVGGGLARRGETPSAELAATLTREIARFYPGTDPADVLALLPRVAPEVRP